VALKAGAVPTTMHDLVADATFVVTDIIYGTSGPSQCKGRSYLQTPASPLSRPSTHSDERRKISNPILPSCNTE
jgi:hypothetical protein